MPVARRPRAQVQVEQPQRAGEPLDWRRAETDRARVDQRRGDPMETRLVTGLALATRSSMARSSPLRHGQGARWR